jgi:hypothetical protein
LDKGINQNDIEERNQQVTKMFDLYSMARSVIAWLGEMTPEDTVAYPFIPDRHPDKQWTHNAIINLLHKPYWSRMWIVQEALLPHVLEFWLGEYRANAEELGLAIYWYVYDQPDIPGFKLLLSRGEYRTYRNPRISRLIRTSHDWPLEFELRWLIEEFSKSQCSVVHDKVYALLGLTSQKHDTSHRLIPNYNTSTKQLFVKLLQNQCAGGEPDLWKERDFLNLFRRVLALDREELARYSLELAPNTRDSIFVLARGLEITASLHFVNATDILHLPYRYEYWYHTRRGVQLTLPSDVQSIIDSFNAGPERERAFSNFFKYRWLGSRLVASSEAAVALSQRAFIDALTEQSQHRATGHNRDYRNEYSSTADVMSCAITKNTQECLASMQQVAEKGDTGEATHPITYLSRQQILAEGMRLAVFAGATHLSNALVLEVYTDRHLTPPETRYEVRGIAFILDQESLHHSSPSKAIRFRYCNLPSLMDFRRVNVLDEVQLSTIFGAAFAAERGEQLTEPEVLDGYEISVGSKENYFETSLERSEITTKEGNGPYRSSARALSS